MMVSPIMMAAEGVPPLWVAIISAITGMGTLGVNYLIQKNKSDASVKIAQVGATDRDKKITMLAQKLESTSKELQEARRSETKLRTHLGVLSIKLNTITGVVKELAPDRPEIVRIVEKIESSNAGI